MTKDEAKRIIVVSTAGTVALTAAGAIRNKEMPAPAVGVGATVAGVMLAGVAEVWPNGAGGIAATMLVTSALVFGGDAWEGIATAAGRTKPVLSVSPRVAAAAAAGATVNPNPNSPTAPPATPSQQQPRFGVPGS